MWYKEYMPDYSQIRVYKNGDERDPGKLITITRREYKHWIIFLDALTRKLGTTTAINRLYSVDGLRFAELEHNGEYVAVERGPFIDCNYGAYRIWTQTEKVAPQKWTSLVRVTEGKPVFLDSGDSMDLYLKKQGYGSTTGLPYPLDGLSRSPNASASQLCEDKVLEDDKFVETSTVYQRIHHNKPVLQSIVK
ncbi:unnamed protein product [Haemonchus placei]|uniref:Doublecortin domain-containing protein n=1 Tax=Haemonchus placei TaxID=6290 RepID=A0A0N4WK14_HAEPC|nr:unnamed protein product [Haemonchus placei]